MATLEQQLSLREGGGIYFSRARVNPISNKSILFVGLGGTGADALLRIKNQIKNRMNLPRDDSGAVIADTPNNIAFLEVDGDEDTAKKAHGQVTFNEYGKDFQCISVPDLPGVIENTQRTKHNSNIYDWFDDNVNAVAGSNGAGGIRQIGRLMLFYNISGIAEKINTLIRSIAVQGSNSLYIFLVTGIAGGTGSGTFIDMAYILRQMAANLGRSVQLFGYIVTPDLNEENGGRKEMLYSNGFACLKELDYWMSMEEHEQPFVQNYGSGVSIEMKAQPFDFCHIVSGRDSMGNLIKYSEALNAIAENMFAYISDDMGLDAVGNSTFDAMYSNIRQQMNTTDKPVPACYRYLSIGADMRRIPYAEIATLFGVRMFEKLKRPIIDRAPTAEEYKAEERALTLRDEDLQLFIVTGVSTYPLDGHTVSWNAIWSDQSKTDTPYDLTRNWLAHAQSAIERQMGNLASDKEGVFNKAFRLYISDLHRGPCYVSRLLKSRNSFCLVNTLEEWRKKYSALASQCSGDATQLKQDLDTLYSLGKRAGIGRRGRAARDYADKLREYRMKELDWYKYHALDFAVGNLLERLKEYHSKLFYPIKETLEQLYLIFKSNMEKLQADDAAAANNPDPKLLIRPLEFEQRNLGFMSKKVDDAARTFTANLRETLSRWIEVDFDTFKKGSVRRADVCGAVSEYIENSFIEMMNTTVESLLNDALAPGDTLVNAATRMFMELNTNAHPMFAASSTYNINSATQSFAFVCVPRNCNNILANANFILNNANFKNPRCKQSVELDKVYWVKVLSGMPLYAFAKLKEMETDYENMWMDQASRMGLHLRYDWHDRISSPLPEKAWEDNYRCESTFKRNSINRANYDTCLQEEILCYDNIRECMVLKCATQAPNIMQISGNMNLRMQQINGVRDNCWSINNEKIDLFSVGRLFYSNDTESFVTNNVRENVLRFYDICERIAQQTEYLKVIESARKEIECVKYYVYARAAELFFLTPDMKLMLRKSPMDHAPVFIYDYDQEWRPPHEDYHMYKTFLGLFDDDWKENLEQQRKRVIKECQITPEKLDTVKENLEKRVSLCQNELDAINMELLRVNADARYELLKMQTYFTDCAEACKDFETRLTTPAPGPVPGYVPGPAAPTLF